jgi:radical SAM superfamily enzyme YgiQ (UPF0313 family)
LEILLVDALARGRYGKRMVTVDAIGAGPRTVAGVLEQKGQQVDLLVAEDVFTNPSVLRSYDAVMISAMSIDEPTVKRLVRYWRRSRGRRPVVVGGPIASDPGFVVRVGADLGIYGESEPVVERLVESGWLESPEPERLRGICGTAYPELGRLRVNPRCPIMPRRVWERYRPSTRVIRGYPLYWAARVYVEAVRGCSNYQLPRLEEVLPPSLLPEKPKPGCAYCSVVSLWGYARSRSIDMIYNEVKSLIDEGVHRIVLSGPDFLDYGRDWLVEPRPLVDPSRPPPNLEAIRGLLSRLSSIPEIAAGEAAIMVENLKPNLVTEEVADTLAEYLRGTPVHIGAESGDEQLLKALARPAGVRDAVRAVRLLSSRGLRPYIYIMYCLPGENRETINKTIELMEKLYRLGAEKITAYRFMPLPLSALEKLRETPPLCQPNHPVREKAAEVNIRAKKRMIGKTIRAIVAGLHPRLGHPVAYPMPHGPVALLVAGPKPCVGDIVEARITGIHGDHMVEAVVLRVLARTRVPARGAKPGNPGARGPPRRRRRRGSSRANRASRHG